MRATLTPAEQLAQADGHPEPERRPRRRRRGLTMPRGELARRLAEENRALIDAAPVELVERDGRVYTLRRLPGALDPLSGSAT